MKNRIQKRSSCPINFALEEFGDVWSLLIVRDIMLTGKVTYNEFLTSAEKIATNILADRLEKLLRHGFLKKTKNPHDKRQEIYHLTQKGHDLYPVMKEIMLWSKKYDTATGLTDSLAKTLREENQKIAENTFKETFFDLEKLKQT